jgi:hypothetical protein
MGSVLQNEDKQDKNIYKQIKNNINFVALFRGRTIPTERPPLVGEINANFCG